MHNQLVASLVVAGFVAARVHGGPSVTVTPLAGTVGAEFTAGAIHAFEFQFDDVLPGNVGNLYDNVPTFLGGAADPGICGPFCIPTEHFVFADWSESLAWYGDDLHAISAGGPGTAVVTALRYGYLNTVATATHTIRIYDMVPPSVVPSVTAPITKGGLLTIITIAGNPSGANMVTVTGLGLHLPQSAIWVTFAEQGPGAPETFWLTGGYTFLGYSHSGLDYSNPSLPPYPYNVWIPGYLSTPGGHVVLLNAGIALDGFHVPGPATVGLLGLGGLVILRRRRV